MNASTDWRQGNDGYTLLVAGAGVRMDLFNVKPGIRITIDAALDKRLVGRTYTLVTLAVERVRSFPDRLTAESRLLRAVRDDFRTWLIHSR